MEPKTKLQKQVYTLSQKLPAITGKQIEWAYKNCLGNYYSISRNRVFCMECGHKFEHENALFWEQLKTDPIEDFLSKIICPSCNTNLSFFDMGKRPIYTEKETFTIYTTFNGFQVVRVFEVQKTKQRTRKAHYHQFEIIQHWVSPNGKIVSLARLLSGMGYDRWWSSSTSLEVRTYPSTLGYDEYGHVYPRKRLLPNILRNGFTGETFGFLPHFVWAKLLNDSMAETLLKANQKYLFKVTMDKDRNLRDAWPAVRILLRNGIFVDEKKSGTWLDYVEQLVYLGMDIRNIDVIWPKDLYKAHNKLTEKALKLKRLASLAKEEIEYLKNKKRFFGLCFTDGDLEVSFIENVHDFKVHGDVLKHCVFVNEFYKKKNSLILSAKVNGEIVEAVEIILPSLRINQARGFKNKPSVHNTRIVELVTRNLEEIRKRQTTKKSA